MADPASGVLHDHIRRYGTGSDDEDRSDGPCPFTATLDLDDAAEEQPFVSPGCLAAQSSRRQVLRHVRLSEDGLRVQNDSGGLSEP